MDLSSFEEPQEEEEEEEGPWKPSCEPDAQTTLIPLPRAVQGKSSPKNPLKGSLSPDPSLPHFASSASPNYFSPKIREERKFDEEKPKMYGKLLSVLLLIPIFFLSNAVPMEGMITSVILYGAFYLYGYIVDVQEMRRRRGKRALNWFEVSLRSVWWVVKIFVRLIPIIAVWFSGLILLNWLLGFHYPSVEADFFNLGWRMKFVNFPPHSWGGLVLGLWALLCWLALIFSRFGTKSANLGLNCAYRSIYRGIRHLKDEESSGPVNRDAYLHPGSARCGIILLILLFAFTLASLTVYLALGALDWGPVFIAHV